MNIYSKLSLYDTMAMLVIGFLIILCIDGPECCCHSSLIGLLAKDYNVFAIFLISVLSYITGLLFHKLWELILGIFRECLKEGVIWKAVSALFLSFDRNNITLIKNEKENVEKRFHPGIIDRNSHSDRKLLKEYYNAYYRLMKGGLLGNIPILETQEAFLRNLTPVFIVLALRFRHMIICSLSIGCYVLFVILILLMLLIAHCRVQRKIYELVWEGEMFAINENNEIDKNQGANT